MLLDGLAEEMQSCFEECQKKGILLCQDQNSILRPETPSQAVYLLRMPVLLRGRISILQKNS
jgi:hypothetical protein